jgi:type IV pilus assembly protein PilV
MRRQKGVTLIEVLVSMIIFSVGILGMTTLQTRVLQENADQHQRQVAISTAQAITDRMTMNKSPAALVQYATSISDNGICDAAPAQICSESYAAGAEVDADVCSETEMAIYDSWDILCASDAGAADQLINFNARLTCATATCDSDTGDNLTLQLLWRSRTAQLDPRLPTTTIDDDANLTDGPDIDGYIQAFRP